MYFYLGVQGEDYTVFASVGENATLPCGMISGFCGIKWSYNRSGTCEDLVSFGSFHSDRAGRLSNPLDCSLHIKDVTTEDAGLYTCENLLEKKRRRRCTSDLISRVYLSILNGK